MRIRNDEHILVDNFVEIADVLFGENNRPLGEDEFYFLQILVRGKDGNHVHGNNKNRLVKYYIIRNREQLLELREEISGLCQVVNGRAYIHPTRRNAKEVANCVLTLTAETFVAQNWVGLCGSYSTACGRSRVSNDKKFIVDLDGLCPTDGKYQEIRSFIESVQGKSVNGSKIFCELPTVNGYHLITHPFNTEVFRNKYPDIDVHTNNPTLLYYYAKIKNTEE